MKAGTRVELDYGRGRIGVESRNTTPERSFSRNARSSPSLMPTPHCARPWRSRSNARRCESLRADATMP